MLVGYVGLLALTSTMFGVVPTGFIPQTDQAYIITAIQLADGASLERTDAVVQRAERMLRDTPGIEETAGVTSSRMGRHPPDTATATTDLRWSSSPTGRRCLR